jgi:hypothetical protein
MDLNDNEDDEDHFVTPYASPLPNATAQTSAIRLPPGLKTPHPSKRLDHQPSSIDYEMIKEKHRQDSVEESDDEPSDAYRQSAGDADGDDEDEGSSTASGPLAKKRTKRRGGRNHPSKAVKEKRKAASSITQAAASTAKSAKSKGKQRDPNPPPADDDSEADRELRRRKPSKPAGDPAPADQDGMPRLTKPLPSRPQRRLSTPFDEQGHLASMRADALALIERRLASSLEASRKSPDLTDDGDEVSPASGLAVGFKRGRWSRYEVGQADKFRAYGVEIATGINRPLGTLVKKSR